MAFLARGCPGGTREEHRTAKVQQKRWALYKTTVQMPTCAAHVQPGPRRRRGLHWSTQNPRPLVGALAFLFQGIAQPNTLPAPVPQSALRQVVQGVGGLSHEAWRAFANDRRTADAHGFIDGDLIETFLDLGPEVRAVPYGTLRAWTYTAAIPELAAERSATCICPSRSA